MIEELFQTFDDREGPDELAAEGWWRMLVPVGDTLRYSCRYHPSMTGILVVE